jgi:hypothetical protein
LGSVVVYYKVGVVDCQRKQKHCNECTIYTQYQLRQKHLIEILVITPVLELNVGGRHESDIQAQSENGMYLGRPYVEVKELVVSLSDTSTKPWTVMVVDRDATVTDFTMEHPWGFDHVTGRTPLAQDFVFVFLFLF